MKRSQKAAALFREGFNCSQCIIGAFADLLGDEAETALKAAAPFGGGMGRLREVCGAVSGMFIVLGITENARDVSDKEAKKALYEKVQHLAELFKKENGSIVCRELLALRTAKQSPEPEERTPEYYRARPCPRIIESAAAILEGYLADSSGPRP
ncbi:MAG: C_GCAxxG_C_C family protein [Abditibacteriota bacterium]|nr:C_GCAxxG_C_C family protein [Abditibacteriota bacterium]